MRKLLQLKNWITAAACPRVLLSGAGMMLLVGCNGIGDGSTIQTLQIVPANTGLASTQTVPYVQGGAPYKLYQCLRDQLRLDAVFTDGTPANFNTRATWASSRPDIVRVSNGDIPTTIVSNGAFDEFSFQPYLAGTLVPEPGAQVGDTATITATFAGLTRSINVVIGKAELTVVPFPESASNPFGFTGPASLGTGTFRSLTVVGNFDGRIQQGAAITADRLNSNSFELNPILWKFTTGVPDPDNSDTSFVPNADTPQASISHRFGTVRGLIPGGGSYAVEAQLSLCSGSDPTPLDVQVLPLASTTPSLTLEHEDGFTGDFVVNTNEVLKVNANLDTDADGDSEPDEPKQDISTQVSFGLSPLDVATGINPTFTLSSNALLQSVSGTTGGMASVTACFPRYASTASLTVNPASIAAGGMVTLNASAFHPDPSVTIGSYTFDFGDGSTQVTQSSSTADHSYATAGVFIARVTARDTCGAIGQNTAAAQIVVGTAPTNPNPPVAALTITPSSGIAPLTVTLDASASSDPDSGDRVAVYSFDFGDGNPVVNQSGATVTHVYLQNPASQPSVVVTDARGAQSMPAFDTAATLVVSGSSTISVRSNVLQLNAVVATLDSITICAPPLAPDLVCVPPTAVTEQAFTFPGIQFEAIGSFTATSGNQEFAGGTSITGNQKITRLMNWAARRLPDSTESSDIVFVSGGQVSYLKNVFESTDVAITATPGSTLATAFTVDDEDAPTPATLTVTCLVTVDTTCPP